VGTLPPAIFRHWVHSQEEDTAEASVYRPSSFPFPPARGRTGFEIRANGEFVAHDIGATDGWVATPGHWEAHGAGEVSVQFDDPRRPPLTLRILSCDENTLRIER
jgi:hypothetical protein